MASAIPQLENCGLAAPRKPLLAPTLSRDGAIEYSIKAPMQVGPAALMVCRFRTSFSLEVRTPRRGTPIGIASDRSLLGQENRSLLSRRTQCAQRAPPGGAAEFASVTSL